jgi:Tol biopolymer transport system component
VTSDPRPDEPERASRWKRLEALFQEASARPAADRLAFLAVACADDEAMRRDVESLLKESDSDDGFLATPPLALPPHVVADLVPATMIGTSLGEYHLLALLGSGGMGEVYRARDAKLGREVAIKVLPSAFTSHPERLARFEREARMLAAVSHPNICGIYGFEEADGVRFLILELVEGDTLAETIARACASPANGRGLPPDRVQGIARQVAEALEVAHDKGIVHRDLKPANIKITPDGVVKILDFGLAKPVSGDGSSPDLSSASPAHGELRHGGVVGTAAYMSPEQARGLSVDRRTDIWAFGCVVYEMLTGRATFGGETASDSIARVLEREPDWSALPPGTSASVRRLLLRCLIKDPRQRLRDIGDARLEIDAMDEALPIKIATPVAHTSGWHRAWLPWAAFAVLAVAVGTWEARRAATSPASAVLDHPLANATFSRVTNWEGTEEHADISPDGRFVTFLADRAGQLDVWVSQLGTGKFDNLTADLDPLLTPGNLLRSLGFTGDGSEIWFNPIGNPGLEKVLSPLTGGVRRAFLGTGYSTPSWSPDNAQLVHVASSTPGDPLSLADRTGADARLIAVHGQDAESFFAKGVHTHNPVWSIDGQWIYFVHGREAAGEMDVWRMQPSGARAERLTHQNAPVNFLAPIDARTVLYVARAPDWSGPWLWALDVESKVTRRVTAGLEQYTFVSASRDGRRIVATVERPTATLWRVPLQGQPAVEADAESYAMPSDRAFAPRFGGTTLFYLSLSSRGTGDGLWRVQNDQAFEVRKGADGVLMEPPAASPDGTRVAVVVRQQGKRRLLVMAADGTNARTIATSFELRGVEGQGTVDWSPDGAWLVTAGDDGGGPGVFKIHVDGGVPVRLTADEAVNPVWAPAGDMIVYAVPFGGGGGRNMLRAVRPDGTPVEMPEVRVRRGGAHRFLRSGRGLVFLPGPESKDFWLVDLTTKTTRQLTNLGDRGYLSHFDVTPDGKYLLFDRSRQNSDVVLIERPR